MTLTVLYAYNGGAWISSVAVSCMLAAGGDFVWQGSATVVPYDTQAIFPVVGLIPNGTYICTANTTNSAGTSLNNASAPFITISEPPAPPVFVNISAIQPRNATVTLTFGYNGGAWITLFAASCGPPGEATATWTGWEAVLVPESTTFGVLTATGLWPNTTYACTGNLTNVAGTSLGMASLEFITIPEPPTAPAVLISNILPRNVTLTVLYAYNGGAWISNVAVSCMLAAGGDFVWQGSATVVPYDTQAIFPVVGLIPNGTYICTANTTNSAGTSLNNASAPFITISEPPAPPVFVNISAIQPRNATVTLTFGYNGGAWITLFAASCGPPGEATATWTGSEAVLVPESTTFGVLTATGLWPNTTYACTGNLTSVAGTSLGMTSLEFITIPEPPTAPLWVNISAIQPRNASLTVTFAYNGGAWITTTAAHCTPDDGAAVWGGVAAVAEGDAESVLSVVGLFPNTTYLCAANTTNSAGTSISTSSERFITIAEISQPPASVAFEDIVSRGVTLVVTLAYNGGSFISLVSASCVTASEGAVTWQGSVPVVDGAAGTVARLNATGLWPNTTYVCSANATNAVDTSPTTSATVISGIEPAAAPALVEMSGIQPRNATITVLFGYNGGSFITSIQARCLPQTPGATEGSGATAVPNPETDTSVTFLVSGMTPNTTYVCDANATNDAGTSPTNSSITFITIPEPPTAPLWVNVSAIQPRNASLTVTFAYNGGAWITTTTAHCTPDDGAAVWGDVAAVAEGDAESVLSVVGLFPNTTYTCAANTTNSAGTSISTSSERFITIAEISQPPASVAFEDIVSRGVTLVVTLAYNGGSFISLVSASCVTASEGAVTWQGSVPVVDGAARTVAQLKATGLWPNTTYVCSANATNAVDTSPTTSATVISGIEPAAAPALVEMSGIQPRNATITVLFGYNGGSFITSIQARCLPQTPGATEGSGATAVPNPETDTSVTFLVSGMTPNTTYVCDANATNDAGTSPTNSSITFITIPEPPTAPLWVNVSAIQPRNASLTVTFAYNGGAWITTTTAHCTPDDGAAVWGDVAAVAEGDAESVLSVVGLFPNTTYLCAANTTNSAGTSISTSSERFITIAEISQPPASVAFEDIVSRGVTLVVTLAYNGVALDVSLIQPRNATLNITMGYNGGAFITRVAASCALAPASDLLGAAIVWTDAAPVVPGLGTVRVAFLATGLVPNTTYAFLANATNSAGTSRTNFSLAFITIPEAPWRPTSLSVANVQRNGATLTAVFAYNGVGRADALSTFDVTGLSPSSTYICTASYVVTEVVYYNPAVVGSGQELLARLMGYATFDPAPVITQDGIAPDSGSSTTDARSLMNQVTITYTFESEALATSPDSSEPPRANPTYPFYGEPIEQNVLATIVYDPDLDPYSTIATQIQESTGYRPSETLAQTLRRALLQYAQDSVSVDYGSSTGALAAARNTLLLVSGGHLRAVYSMTLLYDGSVATNPNFKYIATGSINSGVPVPGINLPDGGVLLSLDPNATMGAGVAFPHMTTSPGGGPLGVAVTSSPVRATVLLMAGTTGSDAVLKTIEISSSGVSKAAFTDGKSMFFVALEGDEADRTFVALNVTDGRSGALTAAELPRPSSGAYLGGTDERAVIFVGSRDASLYRVLVAQDGGISAQRLPPLPAGSSKLIVLAAVVRLGSRAVFLQSDDNAEGALCNGEGTGLVHFHILDSTGLVASVPAKMPNVCPKSFAVSPDEQYVLVLSTTGSFHRASLRASSAGEEPQEMQVQTPAIEGGGRVLDFYLASRAYAVVAIGSGDAGGGPRLGLVSVLEGAIEPSTVVDITSVFSEVSGSGPVDSIVLRPGPTARQFYLVIGTHVVRLEVEPGTARVTGEPPAMVQIGSSLPINYIVGGFTWGITIRLVSVANMRPVLSFTASNPAGNSLSRQITSVSLNPPQFSVGGTYAAVACLMDEDPATGCSDPALEFVLRDSRGSAWIPPRAALFRMGASDGDAYFSGRLFAVVDGISVESPQRGMAAASVDTGVDPASHFEAVANFTLVWNDPARWATARGPARYLQVRLGMSEGRWGVASLRIADATGELVEWRQNATLAVSEAVPMSARVGESIEAGLLNVSVYTGGTGARRGWVALSNFRLWAFGAPSLGPRSFGCGDDGNRTAFMRQAPSISASVLASALPSISAVCAAAEPVPATVRATIGLVGIDYLLDRISETSGQNATVATARRRRLAQVQSSPAGRSDTVSLVLGRGPRGMEAAVNLGAAVEMGEPGASLIQGLTFESMDEIINPKPGSAPGGIWTTVLSGSASYEHACIFGSSLFTVGLTVNSTISIRAFSFVRASWSDGLASKFQAAQAAFACAEPLIYVFGGLSDGAPTSSLHTYSTITSSWTSINTTGAGPAPRYGALLARAGDTTLFLAGGAGAASQGFTDAWSFELTSLQWSLVAPTTRFTSPARTGVGVAASPGAFGASPFFVFGGVTSGEGAQQFFNELVLARLDASVATGEPPLSELVMEAAFGEPPSPRALAAVQVSSTGSQVYVTGGYGPADEPVAASELFIYDVPLGSWMKLVPSGAPPAAGSRASFFYSGNFYVGGPSGLIAWGLRPFVNAVPTAPYIPEPPKASDSPPQLLYPDGTTVVVAGGPVSASWACDVSVYRRARVQAFPIDGSVDAFTVCDAQNIGLCLAELPIYFPTGMYRVTVDLLGPNISTNLFLESDPFKVVPADIEAIMGTVSPDVIVYAPALYGGETGTITLGAIVEIGWYARGLSLPQVVTVDLMDAESDTLVKNIATSPKEVSSGFVRWAAEVDAFATGLFVRVTVKTPVGTYFANTDPFTVSPYEVELEGPQVDSTWVPRNQYVLTILSGNPRSVVSSLAKLSLLKWPPIEFVRTVAPVVRLANQALNGTSVVNGTRAANTTRAANSTSTATAASNATAAPQSPGGNSTARARRSLLQTKVRNILGEYVWDVPEDITFGLYVLKADVLSDAAVGQTPPFCVGLSCEPGFIFRNPAPLLGSTEMPRLYIGKSFTIRWASAGIMRTALVQISMTNFATGKSLPICVRQNSGTFTFFVLDMPPAYIIVRLPDGRTGFRAGKRITIRWDLANVAALHASIRLVRASDNRTIADVAPNTGSYVWQVEEDVMGGTYNIEVGVQNWKLSSTSNIFEISAARPSIFVATILALTPGQQYTVKWNSTGVPRSADVAARVALVSVASNAVVRVVATDNRIQSSDWVLPRDLPAGQYRFTVNVTVGGGASNSSGSSLATGPSLAVSNGSNEFPIKSAPTPDPCLGLPPTAFARVSEPIDKIGPSEFITVEAGRRHILLDATGSVTCDGRPIELSNPKRPAVLEEPTAVSTKARRLLVGLTTFQLTVMDKLGQSNTTVVRVRVLHRMIATAVVCVEQEAAAFAAWFNATTGAPTVAAAFGGFLGRTLDPSSFGEVRATRCNDGSGSGAISAQIPAVLDTTGTEIFKALQKMTPADFSKSSSGSRRGVLQSGTGRLPRIVATRVSLSANRPLGNEPPSTPPLSIVPASKYNYIIVDKRTKIGTVDVAIVSFDRPPGVVDAQFYEWYLDDVLQSSTTDTARFELKPGNYTVRAIALDDENLYAESDVLTLYVVDEYTCNVDLVILLDASTSEASYNAITGSFLQKLLRPFWLQARPTAISLLLSLRVSHKASPAQGPDSYAWIVRYGLPPAGNASVVIARAEVKAAYDAVVNRALPSETNPVMPRLLARGIDAGRVAIESSRRTGVVRSMLVVSFDEPLDAAEARNASIRAIRRNNVTTLLSSASIALSFRAQVFAVPVVSDPYGFGNGFGLFREIPNTTTMFPITLELQEEVEKAAGDIAQAICEGKAPPGGDETDIGETIGRAITVAVAVAIASGVASSVGSSVGASMGGGIGGGGGSGSGAYGIINQAQFISETSFLAMNLPGTYNSTASSTQWTMLYLGGVRCRGLSSSNPGPPLTATTPCPAEQFGQRTQNSSKGASGPRGRRLLGLNSFSREAGGELGAPFLEESLFWTLVLMVGITTLQTVGFLLCRYVLKLKETPKIIWFPKPQITVLILAYEGFVLACAATARLNDTYWQTIGAILVDELRLFRQKQQAMMEGAEGAAVTAAATAAVATPGFLHEHVHHHGHGHGHQGHHGHAPRDRGGAGAALAAVFKLVPVPLGSSGANPEPRPAEISKPAAATSASAANTSKRAAAAALELFPADSKPMDEYNRTKRWFRRMARAAYLTINCCFSLEEVLKFCFQVRESREGRRRLARWWHDSLLRHRLRLVAVWMNWERGAWVLDPRKRKAGKQLWSARNFRWTYDPFFVPYR
eukprot:tig00021015_g17154.t1